MLQVRGPVCSIKMDLGAEIKYNIIDYVFNSVSSLETKNVAAPCFYSSQKKKNDDQALPLKRTKGEMGCSVQSATTQLDATKSDTLDL